MVTQTYPSLGRKLRIIYMATADFALPALTQLVEQGYQICAIVTGPDKPAGRGMKLQQNSIKRYALEVGIEILQPHNLKDESFISRLRELDPDLGLVVAFRMLPEIIWRLPRLGTVNLHGSLLPRYRGAAPIHWAVINGDQETGVSTFQLKHEIDTGDILLQARTAISLSDTTGSVYERLMHLGADLLIETVECVAEGNLSPTDQNAINEAPTHAPKLTKENTKINWELSATQLYNFVRGLNPTPSAWTELRLPDQTEPITLKVHATEVVEPHTEHQGAQIGEVVITGRNLDVVCGQGILRLIQIQPAGRRTMLSSDYLNGLLHHT